MATLRSLRWHSEWQGCGVCAHGSLQAKTVCMIIVNVIIICNVIVSIIPLPAGVAATHGHDIPTWPQSRK